MYTIFVKKDKMDQSKPVFIALFKFGNIQRGYNCLSLTNVNEHCGTKYLKGIHDDGNYRTYVWCWLLMTQTHTKITEWFLTRSLMSFLGIIH